jgi:hypothetical protein
MDFTLGNDEEWLSLYETDDLEAALAKAAAVCEMVVCTRSGDPVILLRAGKRAEIPVERITPSMRPARAISLPRVPLRACHRARPGDGGPDGRRRGGRGHPPCRPAPRAASGRCSPNRG